MQVVDRRELRQRIAARPNSVTFAELEQLLFAYGWHFHRMGKGDHRVYRRGEEHLALPFRRGKVLAPYVRRILRLTEGEDDD